MRGWSDGSGARAKGEQRSRPGPPENGKLGSVVRQRRGGLGAGQRASGLSAGARRLFPFYLRRAQSPRRRGATLPSPRRDGLEDSRRKVGSSLPKRADGQEQLTGGRVLQQVTRGSRIQHARDVFLLVVHRQD